MMEKDGKCGAPRFEFRIFAPHLGTLGDTVRRKSPCRSIHEVHDIYLVTANNARRNVKIRDGSLDVKEHIATEHGLELWQPREKHDLPCSASLLKEKLSLILGVAIAVASAEEVDERTLVEEILQPHPHVLVAQVFKRRFSFILNSSRVEIVEILVNGTAVQTLAVEDESVRAAQDVCETLGVDGYENVNYLKMLKRIMGLVPLPAEALPRTA